MKPAKRESVLARPPLVIHQENAQPIGEPRVEASRTLGRLNRMEDSEVFHGIELSGRLHQLQRYQFVVAGRDWFPDRAKLGFLGVQLNL